MPNHFHGIISFDQNSQIDLGTVIKGFKRKTLTYIKQNIKFGDGGIAFTVEGFESIASMMKCDQDIASTVEFDQGIAATRELIKNYYTIWQKSFYDHIIRDEKDLQRIREYICNNPLKWELDILNPKNDEQFRQWSFSKNLTPGKI